MIVAGIGCRKGVAASEVVAAVEASLAQSGLVPGRLSALSTARLKQSEAAIFAAAEKLGLPVIVVDDAALAAASSGTISHSALSQKAAGTPSVSEAAALAAAGAGARLLGPRTVTGPVTCAIAIGGEPA